MTQPKMSVEGDELWALAARLEAPIPPPPSGVAPAPCLLDAAYYGADRLQKNAKLLLKRLDEGTKEWQNLAKSLRNAAMAYEEVDFGAAEAITTGGSVSAAMAGRGDGDANSATPDDARGAPPPPATGVYMNLREASIKIQLPDNGSAMLDSFGKAWRDYQLKLRIDADDRFPSRFEHWSGDAADAVQKHFAQQRAWANSIADLAMELGKQASSFASSHRSFVAANPQSYTYDGRVWSGEHPTFYEIDYNDNEYNKYVYLKDQTGIRLTLMIYEIHQKNSSTILEKYADKADSIRMLDPADAPRAYQIDAPIIYPDHPIIDVYDPDNAPNVTGIDDTPLGTPGGDLPFDESLPSLPTNPLGMPPTDTPAMPDTAALADATAGAPNLSAGAGMKPASFGGGAGVPSMPLQPPIGMDPDAATRTAAAARDAASGLGRGGPGGPMGGGMGGMPMAPGQGQNAGKQGKRAESDEESLYTEERPWTEAIIGARPRSSKTTPDVKDLLSEYKPPPVR